MNVLETEKIVGIETFFTPFDGIGGKLRLHPEDFIVSEISNYPKKSETGKFLIADLTTKNWETNLIVRELANKLHISRQRINFAGTKDKRAVTTQVMSIYKVSSDKLLNIKIKNAKIENVYYSEFPVKIGNLIGNKFDIFIRNIKEDVGLENVGKISKYIEYYGGFPNFYGIQRFGIIRPITHVIGKYIVKDDFEKATMKYIGNPIEGEDIDSYKVRERLEKNKDYSEALKSYPINLNYEKAILNKLVNNPNNFVDALNQLPNNLLTMFIYAYQSYLFNRILSERIRRKLPLNKAIVGDVVLPIRRGLIIDTAIKVGRSNIEKVNLQISKKKAVVSGILFGSDTVYSDGEMGEIEHKIIDSEKIDPRDFIIPDIPRISSKGSRHPLLASVNNLKYKLISDELKEGKNALNLKFELKKGCYATSLLREFMKADDIKNY
ncbi:MAG: tRNA pseudouridine synthase D [Thermoplasmatales archaeon SG8-52-3]|nr:MAG: tRNA pseudouridine synthase D [Thermoplasmatales archaeon SG8-52-3]